MKNVLFFLKCFLILAVIIPLGLLAQPDTIVKDTVLTIPVEPIPQTVADIIAHFASVFNLVVAVLFFVANILVQKIPAIAKIADAKVIAAVLAALTAAIAVLVKGDLAVLKDIPAIIGLVWWLYNLVKGYIDSKKGETIAAKTEQAAAAQRAAYRQ